MPRIENWVIEFHHGRSQSYHRLIGIAFNHPDYPNIINGEPIYTSKLISIDFEKKQAQTKNTLYELGNPHDDWRTKK